MADAPVGAITSVSGNQALARVRTDRLFVSEAEGSSLRVDETLVTLEKPDWLLAERDAMTAT